MYNLKLKHNILDIKQHTGIISKKLIITILILLILSVVAIGTLQNIGIIAHKKNVPSGNEGETLVSITASNYGDFVEYSAGGVSNWKLFYAEGDTVYIIASDYLANINLPTGLNMSIYNDSYPYSAYWSSISNFTASKASDTITTAIASKYNLGWFNDATKDSINANARATADLLNTTAWTVKFGDLSKGIEAIGAPTLEMWVASWNAKGEKEGTDKYVKLYTPSNTTGYYIGNQENSTTTYYELGTNTDGYKNELYFPHRSSDSNCYGYWLASPSADYSDGVMYVNCGGSVRGNLYDYESFAVRPLVSIPSELLVKTANGFKVEV